MTNRTVHHHSERPKTKEAGIYAVVLKNRGRCEHLPYQHGERLHSDHNRTVYNRRYRMLAPKKMKSSRLNFVIRQLGAAGSILFLLGASSTATAAPFTACPATAFLIQQTLPILYGVNLATGYYKEESSDLGTSKKLNALAFNTHDDYLYGWGYQYRAPVRIGSDYQVSPLNVENLPDADFYVGDIAIDKNVYYVYRPGASLGLYAIDLSPQGNASMRAVRIIDGSALNLRIFDMAFHPDDGFAYAVDASGRLYQIDANNGSQKLLSNVGQSGTFGASYFDVDGMLYISRNSDGYVFRIDVSQPSPSAEFYAFGPSSSNNDGARCALAPLVGSESTSIDFGDAPESYGTTLANNGARHEIGDGVLFLGDQVDGESDAYLAPLSDDTADSKNDEDGVKFVTGIELGEPGLLIAKASTAAYLNAWIDWNQNGVFDSQEQVVSQLRVSSGTNYLTYSTPLWATAGSTWSRFRLSSTPSVGPTGGVSDGEVEDYPVFVTAAGVTETNYPSSGTWATVAYEDLWPLQGDFDMNDLVVHLRTRELSRDSKILGIEISGELVAVGAAHHNGFAIRLPGISTSMLADNSVDFWINDKRQSSSPLESQQGEAIFVIANDTWDYVSPGEGCTFYRTEAGCESDVQMRFTLRVAFGLGVPAADFPKAPYDPFLYATPGYWRIGFDEPVGRGLEIHLPGQTPTDAFDFSLLGREDDRSNQSTGQFFRTATGMPWAMHLGNEWQYPLEYQDVTRAYPQFESFVKSSGVENSTWYLPENADADFVFQSEQP